MTATTEIIITGSDQTGSTWDSIRQSAARSMQTIASSVASGSSEITGAAGRAASSLTSEFEEAGREAGTALAGQVSSGMRDIAGDAKRAGTQAGDDLASGLADGVASGASEVRAGARRAVAGVEDEADAAGKEAGGALKERLAAGAAVAGAAVTAALVASIDTAGVQTKLSAQLGGGEWAAQAGRVAGEVYERGVVESMDAAAEAVRAVLAQGLVPEDSSTGYIEGITSRVADLATAFDQDLIPITRAAGKMLKTGLAQNGGQALDILARGFQTNVNEADDLVDTFAEYSTQFRKAGLTGEQALGMMSQALRAGARDSDIAADAIKEFGIQAMSPIEELDKKGRLQLTKVGQAFINVGLDGNKAQQELAKGGSSAAGVLTKVLSGLRGIEDPIMRSQVAVDLFGTQAEDLGDALYAMDPSTAVQSMGKIESASDNVAKTMETGFNAQIENFKRQLLDVFTGPATKFLSFAAEHSQVFVPLAAAIGGMAAAIGVAAAAMMVFNLAVAANPIVLIVAAVAVAVAALIAAILSVWQTNDGFRNFVIGAWGKITNAIGASVGIVIELLGRLVKWFIELPGKILGAVQRLPGIISNNFQNVASKAMYWVGYGLGVVIREFVALPGRAWNALVGLPGRIGSLFAMVASRMWTWALNAVSRARTAFASAPGKIHSALLGIGSAARNAMSGAGSWLYNAGRDVVRGAINGVKSMAGSAYNSVSDMGHSMVNGFRDAIGWHSPARVFIKGGLSIIEGLQLGILRNRTKAIQALIGVGGQLNRAQKEMTQSAWSGPMRVTTKESLPIVAQRFKAKMRASAKAYAKKNPSTGSRGRGSGSYGGGGGGDVTVTISLQGGDGGSIEDLIMQVIRKRIRIEYGGSVQAALGA